MADGAQWLSALAACVSAGTAVTTLYLVRRDKQQARSAPTAAAAAAPSATPPSAPRDPLVAEALAIIRGQSVAHDQKLKQPLKWLLIAIPIIIFATALQVWLTPSYGPIVISVEFVVFVSGILYYANSWDSNLKQALVDGNNKLTTLVQNPKFSLGSARELRLTLKQYVAPRVILEIDDIVFDEFSRRSQTHISEAG